MEIKVRRFPTGEKKRLRRIAFNEKIPAGAYQMLEGGPLIPIQPSTVGETPHGFGAAVRFGSPSKNQTMSEFKSCARWPEDCCTTIGNYSDDTHGSLAAAEGVLFRLREDGFGGGRQFFPVETWVEEKVGDVWVRVGEDRAAEIRAAERSAGVIVGMDYSKVEERIFAFVAAAHKDGPALATAVERELGMSPALGAPYAGRIPDGFEYRNTETGRLSTEPQLNMRLVKPDDPVLRQPGRPLEDHEMQTLIAAFPSLQKFMRKKGGCGLAANQIGDRRRWFVWTYGLVMNPKILDRSEELVSGKEGCLSFPGKDVRVNRHKWIKVEYTDETGARKTRTLEGRPSVIFQHEFDHINGVCIVDGWSGADQARADRLKNGPKVGSGLASIIAMTAALGGPNLLAPPPPPKERSAEDLDRIEAARLKREAKEAKRAAQRKSQEK